MAAGTGQIVVAAGLTGAEIAVAGVPPVALAVGAVLVAAGAAYLLFQLGNAVRNRR